MAKTTLHLPNKVAKTTDPLEAIAETPAPAISDDMIVEYLKSKGFVIVKEIPGTGKDPTESIPTAPANPIDLSKFPPPGERNSEPVQAPKAKWGNPRFFSQAPPNAAPQPPGVPPRGR